MLEWFTEPVLRKAVAGTASSVWSWTLRLVTAWQFKQVFGRGVSERDYSLVYAELALADPSNPFPYVKPENGLGARFSITRPVSGCELRSVNYLSGAIGGYVGIPPSIRSDVETRHLLDFDFVSLGGPYSNLKTADCQNNTANSIAVFDQGQNAIVRLSDRQPLALFEPGFDYGLILKVRPVQFPERVWLACAGLGEWGTSGSAWFLANKWRELRKHAQKRPFAALIRVRPGQDQSAELIKCSAGDAC